MKYVDFKSIIVTSENQLLNMQIRHPDISSARTVRQYISVACFIKIHTEKNHIVNVTEMNSALYFKIFLRRNTYRLD